MFKHSCTKHRRIFAYRYLIFSLVPFSKQIKCTHEIIMQTEREIACVHTLVCFNFWTSCPIVLNMVSALYCGDRQTFQIGEWAAIAIFIQVLKR